MNAIIIDGKKILEEIKQQASETVKSMQIKPKLVTLLIGENPASKLYISMKKKACNEVGIEVESIELPENEKESAILEKINDLNKDPSVSAVLIQLPLPKHFNEDLIVNSIFPEKDVDGLTAASLASIVLKQETRAPCTPKGVCYILDKYNIPVKGKNTVIVGHSKTVGKPLALMLLNRNATVTICHEFTNNLENHTRQAEILISATGVPHLIKADMVKADAVVIDVGISKKDDIIRGDVDFENVSKKASYITPVPGGVGPVTIAMVIKNILEMTSR